MLIWSIQEYIQIEIENGLNFDEILDAIRSLSCMVGPFQYLMVHIHTEICNLSYNQFLYIIKTIRKLNRYNVSMEKVAILVNNNLQPGMAHLLIEEFGGVKFSLAVFIEKNTAFSWLLKSSVSTILQPVKDANTQAGKLYGY